MKNIVRFVLLTILILISIYVLYYYWTIKEIIELTELPSELLTALVSYIGIQLIKRFMSKKIAWYDWFYYFGLLAVLFPLIPLPVPSDWLFVITKYGALFLLIPPLFETISLIAASKQK